MVHYKLGLFDPLKRSSRVSSRAAPGAADGFRQELNMVYLGALLVSCDWMLLILITSLASAASTGGKPVADSGGVRPSTYAEETGVSQWQRQDATGPADDSGWPAV